MVRAVFDLAGDPCPVLLERIVSLHERLELETLRGVAHLFTPQDLNAPIHIFARHERFEFLDAHEVLLVESL